MVGGTSGQGRPSIKLNSSHLAGRNVIRQHLQVSCQYRPENGGHHVSIDRKKVYKNTAISQISSDFQTIIHNVTLPEKSNSETFNRHSFHRFTS